MGNKGGGRPRTSKFAEALRQIAAEVRTDGRTKMQVLAAYCYKRAMQGSARHLEMVLRYAEGRPVTAEALPPESSDFANKTAQEIEDFRKKLLRGETLEIPPSEPN